MPFVIHPRVRKSFSKLATVTAIGAMATSGGLLATTGVAAAATCAMQATTTPFTQWGDTGHYFPAPGGSFEGKSTSWTLSGAALTAGNEPFYANSKSDKQSLTISGGGTATSPAFCLDATMPDFRFFAHQVAAGSDLKVTLLINTGNATHVTDAVSDLSDGPFSTWAPTDALSLASALNISANQSVTAQLQFQAPVNAGAWQIDDVEVDPYRA